MTLDLKGTNLDVKDEYKDYLFMFIIWGILNISLNCPNAVNTFKEVWILTEMAIFSLLLPGDKFAEHWWKYEDFKKLEVMLYFFILHLIKN